MLKYCINLIIVILMFSAPAYAAFEQVKDFEEESLPILNENFRQLFDRTFQVKSNSDDSAPGYLDTVLDNLALLSIVGWGHNIVFSSTDYNTVAWTTGTITLANGYTTYSIASGNTGNISAITYIYLDTDTSTTVLQTTTTAGTSVGTNKILIAVAENVADATKYATFQVFGGNGIGGTLFTADNIATDSLTANEIAANTITAAEIAAATITTTQIAANTITAGNMNVSTLSAITANLGTITAGSITGLTGDIGGWNITSGYLYNLQSGTPTASPNDGIVIASGNEGIICYEDTAKRLELGYLSTGVYGLKIYDTGGTNVIFETSDTQQNLGGWTLGATSLTSGTGVTTVGLDSGGTNPAIYCGSSTPASAPFRVTNAGVVTATSGTIGGWILGSTTLADNATAASANVLIDKGNSLIRLGPTSATYLTIDGANTRLRTSDYVSGALGSGWNIDTSWAEFNNIRARGRISTAVFEKDVISSVGGNFLVSDSDILNDADMTAADNSTLTILGDTTFAVNDILRIKDGIDDEWLTVTNIASAPTYTVTRDRAGVYTSNANPIWKKGTAVVNYGASGEGLIYMTASDTNAPHIDVLTHAGAPWTTTTTHMRIGNVNGFLGAATDLYGIYIGETNKYLKYDPTNGLQIKGVITCSAGSDVDTGITSAVTDRLFTDSTRRSNIEAWRHASDTTLIDGGDIYTNSITVSKLGTGIFGSGQLFDNGNFEDWFVGTTSAPDGWTKSGADSTVAREGTTIKIGTYSAKLTRVGTDCYLNQAIHADKGIAYWQGKTVTFSAWVYATVADRARLVIYDAGSPTNYTNSSFHTGGSTWQLLTVTRTINADATSVNCWLQIVTDNTSAYFDGAMLVEGSYAVPYADKSRNWGHPTDYTKIDGGDIYTGTVTADKITAGTFVGGNFVIGNGGAFETDNYVADTTGVRLNHEGLEINQGATVMGEGILETIMIYSMLFGGD